MNNEGLNYTTPKMARKQMLSVKKSDNFEMMGYVTPPTQRKSLQFRSRAESLASTTSSVSSTGSE